MKQNVLIVHNQYQVPGGEDMVVSNEIKLLEGYGHKVITYYRYNSELEIMPFYNKIFLPLALIFNPRTYFQVKKIIICEKIDIVHVHNTLSLISPSVYYAAFSCGIPVVQTIHNFRLLCPQATLYRDGQICEDCLTIGLRSAVKHSCYRKSRLQTLACVVNTKIHRRLGTYYKLNYICLTQFNKDKLLLLNHNKKKLVINPDRVFIKPNFTFSSENQYKQFRK